jgi:hypothetical protein
VSFLRLIRSTGFILLALAMLSVGVWCSVAIWYQCGGSERLRGSLATVAAIVTIITVARLATRKRWIASGIFFMSFAVFLVWVGVNIANQRSELGSRPGSKRYRDN